MLLNQSIWTGFEYWIEFNYSILKKCIYSNVTNYSLAWFFCDKFFFFGSLSLKQNYLEKGFFICFILSKWHSNNFAINPHTHIKFTMRWAYSVLKTVLLCPYEHEIICFVHKIKFSTVYRVQFLCVGLHLFLVMHCIECQRSRTPILYRETELKSCTNCRHSRFLWECRTVASQTSWQQH